MTEFLSIEVGSYPRNECGSRGGDRCNDSTSDAPCHNQLRRRIASRSSVTGTSGSTRPNLRHKENKAGMQCVNFIGKEVRTIRH